MMLCCNSLALDIKKHIDRKKNMGEYCNLSLLIYLINMFACISCETKHLACDFSFSQKQYKELSATAHLTL